jgi:pimeloyl-ACP methyl ester carboxylesterase
MWRRYEPTDHAEPTVHCTAIYPASSTNKIPKDAVTLKPSKHQEAWSYCRANFTPPPTSPDDRYERLISPDLDPSEEGEIIFARPETTLALFDLPYLRPAVLWVYGSRSPINTKSLQDEKMRLTGTGRGGSGGEKLGNVEKSIVKGAGHLAPFEKISECADTISLWLQKEVQRYLAEAEFLASYDKQVSQADGLLVSNKWKSEVRKNPIREKL